MTEKKTCPIDGAEMKPVFRVIVLGKHEVQYYCCVECSFLQTEKPFWLNEAYGDAIVDGDTGIMERNLHNALRLSGALRLLGIRSERVIDVAGGYGILTRLLRDAGFDCRWSDKYCENLLSRGFEVEPGQKAAAVCALEVLEHIEDPLCFLQGLVAQHSSRLILFSTEEFKIIPDKDWWYYARDTGQHISFYSVQSLEALATALGWHYISLPRHLHLFTKTPVRGWRAWVLKSWFLYPYALWALLRMRSYSRTYLDRELLADKKGGVEEKEKAN